MATGLQKIRFFWWWWWSFHALFSEVFGVEMTMGSFRAGKINRSFRQWGLLVLWLAQGPRFDASFSLFQPSSVAVMLHHITPTRATVPKVRRAGAERHGGNKIQKTKKAPESQRHRGTGAQRSRA